MSDPQISAEPHGSALANVAAPSAADEVVQDLDRPEYYLNRELSWLDFNDRVLEEARDPRNPLFERVRFLSIASKNLDEFYAKRVAWLRQSLRTNPGHRTVDGRTIAEQSAQVLAGSAAMRREIEAVWNDTLVPCLAERGLRIVSPAELDAGQRAALREYFEHAVYPVLTPFVVDTAHPFPVISSGSVSVILDVTDPRTGHTYFARVKVPPNRPRFVDAGGGDYVMLEDLIATHIDMLFPGVEIANTYNIRVLRSIELGEPGEAADDLLELIERELQRRPLAEAVSLELTVFPAPDREELLLSELHLGVGDMVFCRGPLGLGDASELIVEASADELYPPLLPAVPFEFAGSASADHTLFFTTLQQHDVLVQHPYHSFDATVARFFEEAAYDPMVLGIKQTLYRTSPGSPMLQSLITASQRGKQVTVVLELTARMDEHNNIEWARRLEDAGVHVAYGKPGEKVHGKICLVVRDEAEGVRLYGHIGTGNYNARTAHVFEDFGLFTSNPAICGDLLRVFNHLTGLSVHVETTDLLVAPENLRREIEARIRREIEFARAGRPARLVFKLNALEDRQVIRLLYEASQAGVTVDLLVRGICRIRPGVAGLSDRISVTSVVGRFLEHSRVYYFQNDGDPEYFIGSADLMVRNLDERTEVLVPVRSPEHRAMLQETLDLLRSDTRQGWRLHDAEWTRDATDAAEGTHATLLRRAHER